MPTLLSRSRTGSLFKRKTERDELSLLISTPGFRFNMNQFDVVKVVGSGACASVALCKHKPTGQQVALKMIAKGGCSEDVGRERNVVANLMTTTSPFVVKTYGTFQDDAFLYYVMEYVNGGELFATLQVQKDRRFTEHAARFYLAEVILGLRHVHERASVIHRDLKPENILISEDGHAKLIDFGFAKPLNRNDKTYTLCGTPEYTAPEMVKDGGYGFSADHWSLGVLLYEMLVGRAPFSVARYDGAPEPDYTAIIEGKYYVPEYLSEEARNLIRNLLVLDPRKRLGATGGLTEIRQHAFFAGFDWDSLEHNLLKPPKLAKRAKKNMCFIPQRTSLWTGSRVDESVFADFSGVFVPDKNTVSVPVSSKECLAYEDTKNMDALELASNSSSNDFTFSDTKAPRGSPVPRGARQPFKALRGFLRLRAVAA